MKLYLHTFSPRGFLLALTLFALGGCSSAPSHPSSGNTFGGHSGPSKTELKITDVTVGSGKEAVKGALIKVNYEGFLEDGTKFDSSYDRGDPFVFSLGAGQVIKGWDEGFEGMKVGGKRTLFIPYFMGYGERGSGPIPPYANLIFNVELLDVRK